MKMAQKGGKGGLEAEKVMKVSSAKGWRLQPVLTITVIWKKKKKVW